MKKYVISMGLIMFCVGCGIGAYFFFQKGNEKFMEEKRQIQTEQQTVVKQEERSEPISEEKTETNEEIGFSQIETTNEPQNSSGTEIEQPQPVTAAGNVAGMKVPKTGDVGIFMAYSLLAGLSLAVMGAVLIWNGQKS